MRRRPLRTFGLYLAVVLVVLFFTFPIYWMVKGSFEPAQAFVRPNLLPQDVSLANYGQLLDNSNFLTHLGNSVGAALISMSLSISLACLAGYGLARFRFKGRTVVGRSVLFVYMFPSLALAIPLYGVFNNLGLTNTTLGLALAHTSLSLPFGIWLMWQSFQTISTSYAESAAVLGASRIRAFFEVELPLARPALIAFAIFAFALSWDDYTLAFIIGTSEAAKTLPVGIMSFVEGDVIHWGAIMAAGVAMALPAFLIVLLLQRYLVRGLTAGGLKG